MNPLALVVAILAVCASVGALWYAVHVGQQGRVLLEKILSRSTETPSPYDNPPQEFYDAIYAGSDSDPKRTTDNDLVKLAILEMSKVSQLALAPYPSAGAPTSDAQQQAPRQMPSLELITDDDSDPLEAFLGADFVRGVSEIYDEHDESPFGVPGLKAVEG